MNLGGPRRIEDDGSPAPARTVDMLVDEENVYIVSQIIHQCRLLLTLFSLIPLAIGTYWTLPLQSQRALAAFGLCESPPTLLDWFPAGKVLRIPQRGMSNSTKLKTMHLQLLLRLRTRQDFPYNPRKLVEGGGKL